MYHEANMLQDCSSLAACICERREEEEKEEVEEWVYLCSRADTEEKREHNRAGDRCPTAAVLVSVQQFSAGSASD